MTRRILGLAVLLGGAGCKLTEVTVDPGERIVVVQAVLNRSRANQFAVVEYSFNGDTTGRGGSSRQIPPGRPQIPVAGAMVLLSQEGSPGCAGRVDTLREATGGGVYQAASVCPLVAGAQARLRVVTPDGEVVTGETRIPGFASRTVTSGGRAARFTLDTLPIYRERDTLRLNMGAVSGSALQVEVRRAENHANLSFYLFTDSLGLALPGTVVNPFADNGNGAAGFRPGRYYLLTVALADSNYFDYIRSLSDPVTGRGFLNHLSGGIGVFGSVDVESYMLRVTGDQHDPREGTYRITGRAGTANFDFTLEVYLYDDPEVPRDAFSALVRGVVQDGAVDVSGDGQFTAASDDALQFVFQAIRQTQPRFRQYSLRGTRTPDRSPFPMEVVVTNQNSATVLRVTLTAQQVSGPQ